MDGTLGVLLGITMTVVAGLIWFVRKEHRYLRDLNHGCTLDHERIAVLEERRKSQIAEVPAAQTTKASQLRPRTWSEDMGAAEAK